MTHISEFSLELTEELSENIDEAFRYSPRKVGLALEQHDKIRELSYSLVSGGIDEEDDSGVDEDVFHPETGFIIFDWNVVHTREQALLLGMKADYMAANSLLRSCLDGQMKGVLINSLVDEDKREDIDLSASDFYADDVDVDEIFQTIARREVEEGAGIIDVINDTGNKGFFKIRPGSLRSVLSDLGFFSPYEGNEIGDFYRELGEAVHMHLDESLAEQSMQSEGHPFESPEHVAERLDAFFDNYTRTMEILGVLTVIEFKEYIRNNERIKEVLERRNYGLQATDLTKTYDVLSNISNYSE